MGSSNWDTLALGGDTVEVGTFTTPLGVRLCIYKNWLYLYDEHAWRGSHTLGEHVMQVHHGELTYLDLQIRAVRGPQDGVYVVASTGSWYRKDFNAMVGCGVYGWEPGLDQFDRTDLAERWIGVNPESALFLQHYVHRYEDLFPDGHPLLADQTWLNVWPKGSAG
jgi:hypothetical protein